MGPSVFAAALLVIILQIGDTSANDPATRNKYRAELRNIGEYMADVRKLYTNMPTGNILRPKILEVYR